MKTLLDNTKVPSRTYYYLLDFNERFNWDFMFKTFRKSRLCDLTIQEYKQLFEHATAIDARKLI